MKTSSIPFELRKRPKSAYFNYITLYICLLPVLHTAVFAVISFGLLNKPSVDMGVSIPQASEWTFAGVFMGISVLLIALTVAVS
ncbi:uncharacterized protein DEA37_0010053 [Paragonimus westermani]|uniref:Uncharacterized protein n=1 Tax=Paragonimus westermani TaxID=34504 RepID=A0A5J4NMG9_9TREM|nr:uncharacterized protein DEA37_0010053 [Paragonimus westermani]